MTRLIPVLLLSRRSLVKTRKFKDPVYVGDPRNVVRIFSELEADELVLLDVAASEESGPDLQLLEALAGEAFMPLAYGGGIWSANQAKNVLELGIEKVVLNSGAIATPTLVSEIAKEVGSQAVAVSIDYRVYENELRVFSNGGRSATDLEPIAWAKELESRGAGELLLTSIDREGTWAGMDLGVIRQVASAVRIPVVAHGGAGNLLHVREAVEVGAASAVGAGSMLVFQKQGCGVLVNYPDYEVVRESLQGLE